MDFLTNANDFMPVLMLAIPLLTLPAMWAADQAEYWEELESKYAGRIHYEWSCEYAGRCGQVWRMASRGFLGLFAVVVMYFIFLVITNVPPPLYY